MHAASAASVPGRGPWRAPAGPSTPRPAVDDTTTHRDPRSVRTIRALRPQPDPTRAMARRKRRTAAAPPDQRPAAAPPSHPQNHFAGLGAVLAVGLVAYGWIAAWDRTTFSFTDSLEYLALADHFAALLRGEDATATRPEFLWSRFPPLYPLLLALFGGGSADPLAAARLSCAFAVGAAAATWWWVGRERGSPVAAAVLGLGLLLLPHYFLRNLTPISEPLALLLVTVLCGLLAVPSPGQRRLLVAAVIVGMLPLVRSAFLPICIAFPIWLALRRPLPWRSLLLPLAVAWSPLLLWTAYRRAIGAQQYTSALNAERYAEAGIELPSALWLQPWRLLESASMLWSDGGGPFALSVAILVMGLAGVGCVLRLREARLDAWFLAGYIALVLVWPYPLEGPRFLMAVYPLLLVSALSAVDVLARHRPAPLRRLPLAAVLLALPIALLSTPTLLHYLHRASLPVPAPLLGDKREPAFFLAASDAEAHLLADSFGRTRLLLAQAKARLPADACIYATVEPLIPAFAGRRGERYPVDLGEDPVGASARLTACDWFLVSGWQTNTHALGPLYPSRALQGWTDVVLASNLSHEGRRMTAVALLRRRGPGPEPVDRPGAGE